MLTLLTILAQTVPTTGGAQQAPWIFRNGFLLLMVALAVLWIFMLRGKRGEDRKRQQMLTNLKKGDRIQTIGGILGTVVEARDSDVLVKVDESSNAKVRFVRSAIHRVVEEEKK